MNFDWNELAFSSKKPLNSLNAIFIAAPREMSPTRLIHIIKTYLPQGNIVLGVAKEAYVLGLENQPQFTMLSQKDVQPIINKVHAAKTKHTICTLSYSQRDIVYIVEKLNVKKVVLVNGSWYRAFHLRLEFYALAKRGIPSEKISPFMNEEEARAYEASTTLPSIDRPSSCTAQDMLHIANQAATHSYDFGGYQTGVSLGRTHGNTYECIATSFNRVVPFQTYAMHYGASREINFSPMHDLNHYDTVHAETEMIINAQKQRSDLRGTTLFINLLPCPMCARMFTETDIAEFVYSQDHSDGYAVKMLEKAGKKVTRIVQ